MKITNNQDISLALAVWVVHDDYDYINEENYISVTKLLKPLKQLILGSRIPFIDRTTDVSDLISSALGKTIHASLEKVWINDYASSLKKLGYPDDVIKRIKINPEPEELTEECIPIYVEQRKFKEFMGMKIGGKYDIVTDGILNDHKSTSAFSWVFESNNKDYQLQGSLYRWLDPETITEDYMVINFIFTDWQKAQAKSNPSYPQKRLEQKPITLLSLEETEQWVRNKISLIQKYHNASESDLPECTDEEMWMTKTQYKYYSNPEKTDGRSTRNFESLGEANNFKASKGKGVVKIIKGVPKRCEFCDGAPLCTQKDRYL